MQNRAFEWDRRTIESYLQAYPALKRQAELIRADLDEMLAPQAVSFRGGSRVRPRIVKVPAGGKYRRYSTDPPVLIPQLVWDTEGDAAAVSFRSGGHADPTAAKALLLTDIEEKLAGDDHFQRMRQFIRAVEDVLAVLREQQSHGTIRQIMDARLKEQLLVERYFNNLLSDTGIYVKLGIPDRTYSRWKTEIVNMVKNDLQFSGGKLADFWRKTGEETGYNCTMEIEARAGDS